MIALITGASSGIGRDMARTLSKYGYDLIITARNRAKLDELKEELESENDIKVDVMPRDLGREEECISLYNEVKEKYNSVDILINNAGFGLCGEFTETDLNMELSMIDTNIKAMHILTKKFLKDMVEKDKGKILNVASIAGFMPGPLMATYYASKSYVLRLTQSIQEELRRKKSNVKISALCPGPVNTNFNNVANVRFAMDGFSSQYIANYTIKKLLRNKSILVPGFKIKMVRIFSKMLPDSFLARFCYNIQERKIKE
ncbi:MAG: SDR family oxidoreductase [Clostridia bacterium]|nr:SDR family oxidoreductase [Clostridia bacterium]